MLYPKLIRWSGLLAMLGGLMWIGCLVLIALAERARGKVLGLTTHGWEQVNAFSVLAMMCGFVGFYKLHDGRIGRLGAIALGTGFLALMFMFAGPVIEYTLDLGDIGWIILSFGFLLVLPLSLVLMGIATLRARVLAPWCRALPLVFGSLLILLFLQGVLVLLVTGRDQQEAWLFTPMLTVGLGWIAMGFATWVSAPYGSPLGQRR